MELSEKEYCALRGVIFNNAGAAIASLGFITILAYGMSGHELSSFNASKLSKVVNGGLLVTLFVAMLQWLTAFGHQIEHLGRFRAGWLSLAPMTVMLLLGSTVSFILPEGETDFLLAPLVTAAFPLAPVAFTPLFWVLAKQRNNRGAGYLAASALGWYVFSLVSLSQGYIAGPERLAMSILLAGLGAFLSLGATLLSATLLGYQMPKQFPGSAQKTASPEGAVSRP